MIDEARANTTLLSNYVADFTEYIRKVYDNNHNNNNNNSNNNHNNNNNNNNNNILLLQTSFSPFSSIRHTGHHQKKVTIKDFCLNISYLA